MTAPEVLTPLLIGAPLLAAAVALIFTRSLAAQRTISVGTVAACLAMAVGLLVAVERDGTAAVDVGGWEAPLGITLVADLFSALFVAVAMATILAVLVFAIGQLDEVIERRFFHPLHCVLTAGVAASFLTGDLFNLFVAFEVMLIASYVLLTITGGRDSIQPAMTYVVVSLLASTLFISSVGLLYAATGTVNMADLAGRVADLSPELQTAFSLLFLVVFGIKAALFPLFFWLPDSYPTAPAPITAVFAGLLTKVGVYAIIRTQTIVFGGFGDGPSTLILAIAGLTMVVGVLGAIAQNDMKRILSFHIVSQIGYMVLGLGLFTVAGVAGATLFIIHQIPVKTSLFLVGGMVEKATGTNALARLGGLVRTMPIAAILFLLAALSLAGLPPFSGFFGKLALVQAGFAAERWVITGVALGGSILTLFSMTKIWAGVFWGAPDEPAPAPAADVPLAPSEAEHGGAVAVLTGTAPAAVAVEDGARLRVPALMTGAAVGLVALTLGIAVFAEPLYDLSLRAAQGLVDPSSYVEAVLGGAR
jgi:multicomponent Na+:H+ antiporter subunit D